MAIPEGYYGRIAGRSGLAVKKSIDVGGGVVDCDYRGEVCVVLVNHSDTPFEVNVSDRVAHMIITPCEKIEIAVGNLDETSRGESGFGSTGK